MTAHLLQGKALAEKENAHLANRLDQHIAKGGAVPHLAVILVGDDPASEIYIRHKTKAASQVGMQTTLHRLPKDAAATTLRRLIDTLNLDKQIHGILMQLPLPAHLDPGVFIDAISPEKDVDGFHPYNMGRLALRIPTLRPCTPYGIIKLLTSANIEIKGKHCVIVGASNIVGRPMVLECLLKGATVTCAHRFTKDLARFVRSADLLVAAIGKTGVVETSWIKPGSVVVDVGINRLPNGKLVGDIDFETAKEKAGWITPVPGGVGPMTIATLLENTFKATPKP